MAHPGQIIFTHEPGRDGIRYFYVVYHPQNQHYSIRYSGHDGQRCYLEGEGSEMVAKLENELSPDGYGKVALKAAKAIRADMLRG